MGIFDFIRYNTGNVQNIENISINRLIPNCKESKQDTLIFSTSRNCPECKKYNKKVYSLYGWNKKYLKVPEILLRRTCPACNKVIGASIYFEGISKKSNN
ncbi:MAG: hypothetical protein K1W19_14215 [Lachnospiraceae bacterium]|nr:hypothetical protein [Lachnospiraceae bacterium]